MAETYLDKARQELATMGMGAAEQDQLINFAALKARDSLANRQAKGEPIAEGYLEKMHEHFIEAGLTNMRAALKASGIKLPEASARKW